MAKFVYSIVHNIDKVLFEISLSLVILELEYLLKIYHFCFTYMIRQISASRINTSNNLPINDNAIGVIVETIYQKFINKSSASV